MGGVFSEGIDLKEERLIGVIVMSARGSDGLRRAGGPDGIFRGDRGDGL